MSAMNVPKWVERAYQQGLVNENDSINLGTEIRYWKKEGLKGNEEGLKEDLKG